MCIFSNSELYLSCFLSFFIIQSELVIILHEFFHYKTDKVSCFCNCISCSFNSFVFQFPPISETHGTLKIINVSFSTLLQEVFLGHSSFPLSKKKQIFHSIWLDLVECTFHFTELTGQTRLLEGLIPQRLQINIIRRWYRPLLNNARGYHASVPSNCCIFFSFLQTDGYDWSVLTNAKHP